MKNKKGFTLVEILTVLFIIGLLLVIAVPSISTLSKRFTKKGFDSKIELIEKAAVTYVNKNANKIKSKFGNCTSNSSYCKCNNRGCKYTFSLTVDDLVKLGVYKADNEESEEICNVTNPMDRDSCMDCLKINISLNSKYKTVTAKVDTSKPSKNTNCASFTLK